MERFYMIVNVEVERPMQRLRCLEETPCLGMANVQLHLLSLRLIQRARVREAEPPTQGQTPRL